MSYFVYNTGRGRSATHISKNRRVTLCGLAATRHVDVFGPAEASCRECRKRWQIAQAALTSTRMAAPAQATRATGKTLPIDTVSPPPGDGRPRAKKPMGSRAFMAMIATSSGAAVYGLVLLMRICYDHGQGNECHSALVCGSRYTGSSATPASVFSAFGCLGIGLLILGAGIVGIACLVNAVRPSLVRNFSFTGDRTSRSQHHTIGNSRILS